MNIYLGVKTSDNFMTVEKFRVRLAVLGEGMRPWIILISCSRHMDHLTVQLDILRFDRDRILPTRIREIINNIENIADIFICAWAAEHHSRDINRFHNLGPLIKNIVNHESTEKTRIFDIYRDKHIFRHNL